MHLIFRRINLFYAPLLCLFKLRLHSNILQEKRTDARGHQLHYFIIIYFNPLSLNVLFIYKTSLHK